MPCIAARDAARKPLDAAKPIGRFPLSWIGKLDGEARPLHNRGRASRLAEQAARIAAVLTLWRDLHAPHVDVATMADGITLAQFYLSEVLLLADAATVSAEIERAETLRAWLLDSFPNREVTVRDVVQLGPNSLREAPKAKAAIALLVAHQWLAPLEKGAIVRGAARREAWCIVGAANVV